MEHREVPIMLYHKLVEQYAFGRRYCTTCSIWLIKEQLVGKHNNRCPDCKNLVRTTRKRGLATALRLSNQPDPRYIKAIE